MTSKQNLRPRKRRCKSIQGEHEKRDSKYTGFELMYSKTVLLKLHQEPSLAPLLSATLFKAHLQRDHLVLVMC